MLLDNFPSPLPRPKGRNNQEWRANARRDGGGPGWG